MTSTDATIVNAASDLWTAQRDRAPIKPLTEAFPGLDVAGAYAIQQVNLHRRLAAGNVLVGRKIGLTSEPMQTLLGVDEPDYGYILDDMVISAGSVEAARFCSPRASQRASSTGDTLVSH